MTAAAEKATSGAGFHENIATITTAVKNLSEQAPLVSKIIARNALQETTPEEMLTSGREQTLGVLTSYLEEDGWGDTIAKLLEIHKDYPEYLKGRTQPYWLVAARIICEESGITVKTLTQAKNQKLILATLENLHGIISPETITSAMQEVFSQQIGTDKPLIRTNLPKVIKAVIDYTASLSTEKLTELAKQAETFKPIFIVERVQQMAEESRQLRETVASQEKRLADLQAKHQQAIAEMQKHSEALVAAKEQELTEATARYKKELAASQNRQQELEAQLKKLQADHTQLQTAHRELLAQFQTLSNLLSEADLNTLFAPTAFAPPKEEKREVGKI